MFNKRLLSLVPGATRSVVITVVFKMLALVAQVVFLCMLGRTLATLLAGGVSTLAGQGAAQGVGAGALVVSYIFQMLASRSSQGAGAEATSALTLLIYNKLVRLGASVGRVVQADKTVQLMGEGVQRLRPYFANYLPQFFFAVLAPLALFIYALTLNIPVAIVMLVCVPLMPGSIMMLMKRARKVMGQYWGTYVDLGASFMDAVRGLTTLKVYSADERAAQRLDEEAEGFRAITMKLLRVQLNSVTFMDLFSYGAIALGEIIVLAQAAAGALPLANAIVLVCIVPSFFMPMRSFGAQFHTGMNANEVIDQILELLDAAEPQWGTKTLDDAPVSIVCEGLGCSYDGAANALDGVDVEIAPLTFVGITGESGSGKSTLLRALAGQFPDYSGSIRLGGVELRELSREALSNAVTLVSHESHVFKGSVRSNLLLGKPDANDYEMWEALRKARLDDFVIALGGLSSEVAEGGSNLSGGQRQRLCFARAILRDTPIYLFDEAASNVDVESERMLLTVIQEMSLDKTVLFATHRLTSLAHADDVYVLEGGALAEHGTHFALVREEGGLYQRLWQQNAKLEEFATAADGLEMDNTYEPNEVEKILDKLPPEASQMMYAALMARDALKYKQQVEGDAYDPVALGHPEWIPLPDDYRKSVADAGGEGAASSGDAPQAAAGKERERSAFAIVRGMMRVTSKMRGQICASVALGTLSNIAALALGALAVAGLVHAVVPAQPAAPLAAFIAAIAICGIARGPLHYRERLLTHDQTFRTLALLRKQVFAKLRELAPARVEGKDSGELISLLTSDIEMLEGFYSRTVAPAGSAAITAVAGIIAMIVLGSWQLALLACVACLVVGLCVPMLSARLTRAKSRDLRAFTTGLTTFLLDSLDGFSDLVQFGRAAEYAEEMEKHMGTEAAGGSDLSRVTALLAPLAQCVALLADLLALVLGIALVKAGAVSAATAAVCVALFVSLLDCVAAAAGIGFSLSRTLASAERILDVLDEQPQTLDVASGVQLGGAGEVALKDVSFTYPGAAVSAVEHVDMQVDPGMLLRITGKSGAGKSTLLKLMMRFWDADAGSVCLSGTDVREAATASLRAHVAYMTQETYLFDDTLRENITLGRDLDNAKLAELISLVRLDALVERLDGGLDAKVGGLQGRGGLSEGERQRVGLARALAHDAPLLLLDEPTSNLDSLNEAAVLYALASATEGKTVVVISHRRAVAALADDTFVMKRGR